MNPWNKELVVITHDIDGIDSRINKYAAIVRKYTVAISLNALLSSARSVTIRLRRKDFTCLRTSEKYTRR